MQTVTTDQEASTNSAALDSSKENKGDPLPPALESTPDFTACFLADLQRFGQTTASQTRQRHGIPGTPRIGQAVRRLAVERRIRAVGFALAVTFASQGHVERVWELSNGGGLCL